MGLNDMIRGIIWGEDENIYSFLSLIINEL
jgi:hypothetical protein